MPESSALLIFRGALNNVFDANLKNEECEYLKIIFISSDADVHAITTHKLCKRLQASGMSSESTEFVKNFFNALTLSRKVEILPSTQTGLNPNHSEIATTQEIADSKDIVTTHSSEYKAEAPKDESKSMTLDETYKQVVELDYRIKYKREIDHWTLVAYMRKTESQKKDHMRQFIANNNTSENKKIFEWMRQKGILPSKS